MIGKNTRNKFIVGLAAAALFTGSAGLMLLMQPVRASAEYAPAVTASPDGVTFSAYEAFDTADAISVPRTVETVIRAGTDGGGVLFSNYEGDGADYFSVELTETGAPRIRASVGGSVYDETAAASVGSNFVHLAIVLSQEETAVYLDGVRSATTSAVPASEMKSIYRIGGDFSGNQDYFQGNMKQFTLYSEARTDAEIGADREGQKGEAALAYDFTAEENFYAQNDYDEITTLSLVTTRVKDLSGNGNDLIFQAGGAIAPAQGMKFNEQNVLEQSESETEYPQSVEAVIFHPNIGSKRGGVIYGNYYNGSTPYISYEVYTSGNPGIAFMDANYNSVRLTFKSVQLCHISASYPVRREFNHVTFVLDTVNKVAQCYLNGVLGETIEGKPDGDATQQAFYNAVFSTENMKPMCVGGDRRSGNSFYLQGSIRSLKVYSDLRTATEIRNEVEISSDNVADVNLLCAYNFTKDSSYYTLKEGNGNTSVFVRDLARGKDLKLSNDIAVHTGGLDVGYDQEYVLEGLGEAPNSFEAWIKVPKNNTRKGTILGNYYDSLDEPSNSFFPALSLEITAENYIRLWYNNESWTDRNRKDKANLIFSDRNTKVNTGEWIHVAVVRNLDERGATLYLNGEPVQTLSYAGSRDYFAGIMQNPLMVGNDYRHLYNFPGEIGAIALYSSERTSDEVRADYEAVDISDEALLSYLEMWDGASYRTLPDLSGHGNDAVYRNIWVPVQEIEAPSEPEDGSFTIALLPDTQTLNYYDTYHFHDLYDFILERRVSDNIKLTLSLGDITEKNGAAEWVRAKEQFDRLQTAGIGYMVVRGNHDSTEKINEYFWVDEYTNQIGGFMTDGKVENSWRTLDVGQQKYLIISLDYGADDAMLEWAGDVCEAFPERRVIVVTHAYLFRDGSTLDTDEIAVPSLDTDTTEEEKRSEYNDGEGIWQKFVSKHENIAIVVGGHDPYDGAVVTTQRGIYGNVVTQVLVDFQYTDRDFSPAGVVTLFHFSADGNTLKIENYATVRKVHFKAENQLTVSIAPDGDYLAAKAVRTAINSLPELKDVNATHKQLVTWTYEQYIGLTEKQKSYLNVAGAEMMLKAMVVRVTASEERVQRFKDRVAAIGDYQGTQEKFFAIKNALDAFAELKEGERALVADDYQALVAAIKDYNGYVEDVNDAADSATEIAIRVLASAAASMTALAAAWFALRKFF